MITRGRRDTNYVSTALGIKLARVVYLHRFYYASQETVQPPTALRYRMSMWAEPALRWLGIRDKFLGPTADQCTSTDTSVLWFGYLGTNSVFSEDAVPVSDQGLRLPLTPEVEDTGSAGFAWVSLRFIPWQCCAHRWIQILRAELRFGLALLWVAVRRTASRPGRARFWPSLSVFIGTAGPQDFRGLRKFSSAQFSRREATDAEFLLVVFSAVIPARYPNLILELMSPLGSPAPGSTGGLIFPSFRASACPSVNTATPMLRCRA